MSIKLFCLEKGKTPAVQHAFPVNIGREETVGDLKKVIKTEKAPYFNDFPADHLKLWLANIPVDRDDLIQNQTLQDNNQLPATDDIEDHWTDTPLKKHIHIIVEVPIVPVATVRVLTGSPDELYVIVDDSNIYIEGKFAVAEMERIGVVDNKRKSLYFNQLRLDYGRLLKIIQKERTIGENPIVVGSIPPTDSLWEMIRKDGFTVKTYPRNADNREKRVDMRIGQYINGIFRDKVPGVLALVAGDGDFQPVIQDAVQLGWMVEIYFWNSANSLELLCDENTPPLGVSGLLLNLELESKKPKTKEPVFHSLDSFYKAFSYGYGFPRNTKTHKRGKPKNMEVLHFTGYDFSLWKNDEIVIFDKDMFVWWFKEEDNLWMYFKNRRDLGKAKDLMLKTYPDIMEVVQ